MAKINVNLDDSFLEGINSGKAVEVTPVFWKKKHQQLNRYFIETYGYRMNKYATQLTTYNLKPIKP